MCFLLQLRFFLSYTNYMAIKFKKHIKFKHKIIMLVFAILLLFVLLLVYFNNCVNPVIISTSEAKVKSLTSKAVNSAVQAIINDTNIYDELIDIQTNDDGEIVLIQAKGITINKLAKQISQRANQNLDLFSSEGVKIPLGTLSGIPIFVGTGPDLTFNVMSIGTIQSSFSSEFTSAGINQTNHRIYLTLKTDVTVVLPTTSSEVSVLSHILICEAILVGKIPQTYLNSSSLDEMLNLIPA